MKIRKLDKNSYGGKKFKVSYKSEGYYDICRKEYGFQIAYVSFGTVTERTLEDEMFGEWLDNPVGYGAFDGDRMLGFVEGTLEKWNNRFRISNICVFDNSVRNRGIGTALPETILIEARKTGARMAVLETQSCNEKAIAFYRKNGFDIIGFDVYAYSNEDLDKHEVRIEMGIIL